MNQFILQKIIYFFFETISLMKSPNGHTIKHIFLGLRTRYYMNIKLSANYRIFELINPAKSYIFFLWDNLSQEIPKWTLKLPKWT